MNETERERKLLEAIAKNGCEFKTNLGDHGMDYFCYFTGTIRSAGTTASCLVLLLIDYLRELFGYAKVYIVT